MEIVGIRDVNRMVGNLLMHNVFAKEVEVLGTNQQTGAVVLDAIHFPDKHFRAVVKDLYDKNKDNILSEKEIKKATRLVLSDIDETEDMKSVKGIEHLTNLWKISNSNSDGISKVRTLDLRDNKKLEVLIWKFDELKKVIVGKNTNLEEINLGSNNISKIDVSGCPNLEWL
ncbi:MAG: hypothetical protein K6G68_08600, partial [Oscillospiraceae bacterium]|nr:hypothetical protein [Oscillospiraceae bacterium]